MSLVFGGIPFDIADLVFTFFHNDRRQVDVVNEVSNRPLRAEQSLNRYKKVHFKFNRENDQDLRYDREHDIHHFFRLISEDQPEIKDHVESVELLTGVNEFLDHHNTPVCVPSSPNLSPWVKRDRQDSDQDKFRQEARKREIALGNIFHLSEILVRELPDIVIFTTDYSLLEQSDLPEIISKLRNLQHLTVLNNLDSAIVCEGDTPSTSADMSEIFLNPNLRSISTVFNLSNFDHPADRIENMTQHRISLPNLHTLSLIDSTSHPPFLHALLQKCHHLSKLTYFLAQELDSPPETTDQNGQLIGPPARYTRLRVSSWLALVTVLPATLQKLKISVDVSETTRTAPAALHPGWLVRSGRITSLMRLSRLVKLEIPLYLLFGGGLGDIHNPVGAAGVKLEEILPPTLKKIYLRDDYILETDLHRSVPAEILGKLRIYLLFKKDSGNKLNELRLVLRGRGVNDKKEPKKKCLQQLAALRGVEGLRTFERIGREGDTRITVQFRLKSKLTKSGVCLDTVKQTVAFNPTRLALPEGYETGMMGYPERERVKQARAFFENVSEESLK